ELEEAKRFLAWLASDHFTFLGYREYDLVGGDDEAGLKAIPDSGLGILHGAPVTPYTKLSPTARTLAREPHPLVLTKANSRATVHRPSYLDYVGVKRFDGGGSVCGERRFLGLFTHTAYSASPWAIPVLRRKVTRVVERSGFAPGSHDHDALVELL